MLFADIISKFAVVEDADLPWFCSDKQVSDMADRMAALATGRGETGSQKGGFMPSELASVDFTKAFGEPGSLKSHEWLLLAGPVGKYALAGHLKGKIGSLVFAYLDFIGCLWSKTFRRDALAGMVESGRQLLADLEAYLPAWELDINRHMMQHLVTAIGEWGPPWVWSAFGYERLWGRLMEWLHNRARPEASIVLSFRALKLAGFYLGSSESSTQVLQDDGSSISLYHAISSFDRATNEMLLPGYIQEGHSEEVVLFDGEQQWRPIVPTPSRPIRKDMQSVWVELHQFFLRNPELCCNCLCEDDENCGCPTYADLWQQYMQSIRPRPHPLTMQRIGSLLVGWPAWADAHGCSTHQIQLCHGPGPWYRPVVQRFDRARLGPVKVACSKQEANTKAKNSIVMIQLDGKYHVGRVRRFFDCIPPGGVFNEENPTNTVSVVDVDWYGDANRSVAGAQLDRSGLDKELACPVVRRGHVKDKLGNFWDCCSLMRVKLGLATHPHANRSSDIIVLSRHAHFLE